MGSAQVAGPVRFEHLDEPLGIGTGTPRLSWTLSGGPTNWQATGYELALDRAGESTQVVRVASAEQVLVPWPFAPLRSRERV
ncbi:MAG: hypothetical protein LBV60_21285, partial [Streptomyces sp.]|nr:hypothetical protein [Streptomyces sp.]